MKRTLKYGLMLVLCLAVITACSQYVLIPLPGIVDDSTPYDVNTAEDFSNILEETGQVRLTTDITIDDYEFPVTPGSYSIDLNNKSLSLQSDSYSVPINAGTTITIKNGNFVTEYNTTATNMCGIFVDDDASLILEGVNYNAGPSAVYAKGNNAKVIVRDSFINISGT